MGTPFGDGVPDFPRLLAYFFYRSKDCANRACENLSHSFTIAER
jgi:hypothetical protein